ncbi:DUF3035 domain-containing protein [Limibacillus halophilus]|jgi:hypothetical protein
MFKQSKGNAMLTLSLKRFAPLLVLAFGLSACDSVRETFDTTRKNPPDEFRVISQAPLTLPPDYGLRPPEPGAPRPQTGTPTDEARATVFKLDNSAEAAAAAEAAALAGRSQGEQALLKEAGAGNVDPAIRLQIDRETDQLVAAESSFIDTLIFWQDDDIGGQVIDPEAEQRRIRENQVQGNAVTAGETPVIQRKKKAFFEGLF